MENESTPEMTPEPVPAAPKSGGGIFQFLLGLIIGGAVVLGYVGVRDGQRQAAQAALAPTQAPLTADEIRELSRQGAATAIAQIPRQTVAPAPAAGGAQQAPPAAQVFEVGFRQANTTGAENAPVTIVEYSDFNCGYCRQFYNTTFQQVIDEYVKNGTVKVSYKHYPFLADSSLPKAQVAECAAQQGKFWDVHNVLFAGQIGGNTADELAKQAVALAPSIGMDAASFDACMKDQSVVARILKDAEEARGVGITGTPSFLINGKLLVGAQPFAAFRLAIESARTKQ
jgi:protein-disulfide isomerase